MERCVVRAGDTPETLVHHVLTPEPAAQQIDESTQRGAHRSKTHSGALALLKQVQVRFWHTLGALRSKIGPSDRHAEAVFRMGGSAYAGSPPRVIDLRAQLLPVRNQGAREGTCVAQVLAAIFECQERRASGRLERFSPQFVYNFREDPHTVGMSARDGLDIGRVHGDCHEKTYPYGREERPRDIAQHVKDEARKYRLRGDAYISTLDGVRMAMDKHRLPCLMLVPCYNYGPRMWVPSGDDDNPDAQNTIGHAFAIVACLEHGLVLRNSWGPEWGDAGHCLFPLADFGKQWEIWTVL
jgi:hypothetical protein